jgi:hypothetical protein
MNESQAERTLALRVDARDQVHGKMEQMLSELNGDTPSPEQNDQLAKYRSDLAYFDEEIKTWDAQVEADRAARKASDEMRRRTNAFHGKTDVGPDGEPLYRSLGQVAIDQILTSPNRHAQAHVGSQGVAPEEIQRASERLKSLDRTPATTLSSDIAGLTPPQHIAEIFQIIQTDRPLVDAATKVNLTNLVWTYPQVDATPVVAVQGTQKTEAGNTGMDVSMVSKTASTYLGGGNLSWQAITFSTPDAYDLWFRYIAADYALKTETDAATVVSASAFLNNISSTLGATPTYVELMAAIGAGGAEVYANSGRMANAVVVAPDRYWYVMGLATASPFGFGGGQGGISLSSDRPALRVIPSRGLNAGEIIVGDTSALLVAENAGAPVRMFVSEPAIAGVEVGLVGAFDAAVVDDGAFALISTAS